MTRVAATVPPSGSMPLSRRVLNASAWTIAGHGLSMVLRFASNLVLTRLLVPEMFGLMAIGMILINGLTMFSDLGLDQSIVRSKRGNDPHFLNTAWSVQILRGGLLWSVGILISFAALAVNSSGYSAENSVYGNPTLPYVIAALSFGALIAGFNSTKYAQAGRSLALGRVTQMEIASQVAGLICMFAWIAFDRSIWALVAGATSTTVVRMTMTHVWLPGTPNRWHWDRSALHEIVGFGKWVFLSSLLGFLLMNGDRLLLGGLIDAHALGVYSIAFTMFSLIEQIMTRVIGAAAYPAFSEIWRERPHDLKQGYYKFHAIIAGAAYFISGVLIMASPALIRVLYDYRYADAGWMLQILAVGLLATPLQISVQCYMARGMPEIYSRVLTIRLIALVVALPLGFHFLGLPGAVCGIVFSQFVALPTIFLLNVRHKIADLKRELLTLPIVAVGLGAGTLLNLVLPHLRGI